MVDNTPPYEYRPLAPNRIRLLGLSASDHSHTLNTVNIHNAPPYFGLSYAWVDLGEAVPLDVEGRVVWISSSLASALHHLRAYLVNSGAGMHVWIDRLCINQDDVEERSSQILLMKSIYSQAIRTLIWLGPDVDGCSTAWGLIDRIYDMFREVHPHAEFPTDIPLRLYSDKYHASSGLPGWDHDDWHQLRRLFELPWFTRTWIIQEVALSSDDPVLLHGPHRYSWSRLGWVSCWLRRNGYIRLAHLPNSMHNVDTIASMQRSRGQWRLDALVVITSMKFRATDQRDKVYGLLGLMVENKQGPSRLFKALRPDYGQDVTEVYTKVAMFLLQEFKSLAVLTCATGVPNDISQAQRTHQLHLLPSWVPNLSDYCVNERDIVKRLSWIPPPGTAQAGTLGFPQQYKTSAGLAVRLFPSHDPRVLRICGLKNDTVVVAVGFDDEQHSPSTQQAERDRALRDLWMMALPYMPDDGEEALKCWITSWIKATTADHHDLGGRTWKQMFKDGAAFLQQHLSNRKEPLGQRLTVLLDELAPDGDAEIFAALACNFCRKRSFFITQNRKIGIGPAGTKPGDLVCVIFGGGVPYILRGQDDGFLFVGESYVDGLMNGEAMQAWQQGTATEEIFELR